MQNRSLVIALLAAAVTLPSISPSISNAQSMPAGQVSHRMAAQSTSIQNAAPTVASTTSSDRCTANSPTDMTKPAFNYKPWFPLIGPGCTNAAILNFFGVNGSTEAASNVKYIYNAQQSASQVNADLVTATFAPGFQAVFAGTTTAGSSQTTPSSTGTSGTGSSTTTDSVATAVSKIEAGGDFNVRFPAPLYYRNTTHGSITSLSSPNVGFNINGLSSQNTITQATEYSFNVPLEVYAQTKSIDSSSNGTASAVLFLDLKPAAEVISSDLARKIGLTGSRGFFIGQAAVGIEFSQSFRISFQYLYGPQQIYQTTTSTGSSTTTSSRIGGFHLAVSFSPQKSK
jgi:hypothetical protein